MRFEQATLVEIPDSDLVSACLDVPAGKTLRGQGLSVWQQAAGQLPD